MVGGFPRKEGMERKEVRACRGVRVADHVCCSMARLPYPCR